MTAILGLVTPTSGEIRLDGLPWSSVPERERRARREQVQLVPQDTLSSFDPEPGRSGRFTFGGPLDLPRSPQGRPVIVQAGRSPAGIVFAGRYAEVVFTVQQTFEEAKSFRDALRAAARDAGRPPEDIRVLPGLWPFVGSTGTEARRLYDELEELVLPAQVAHQIANFTGLDLSGYDYDEILPELPARGFQGQQGRYESLRRLIGSGQNTLRKLRKQFGTSRGHQVVIGTPEQIADSIIDWYDRGAVDGFSIQPPILPHGLELFVDQVVPELQRRKVFHTDYAPGAPTSRDQLRASRPIPVPVAADFASGRPGSVDNVGSS
ncbi:LLM class flavin-dependent oxidoreductase [Nocardia jinanensis]|uniref:LLM class flavin-dependent oxidoreductase n=1 Tax=Nocardia jinanensis TaxID=382504 RepID=UPI0007A49ED3|nr:LLM class flavin-dependent oxidoreductase [Nocardia jinanensis]